MLTGAMDSPPIVLLTDFGTRDWYAGVLHGVIRTLAPRTPLVDLTHHVPPQDVAAASFILSASHSHFPPGSIFCCVVDPGVGTERAVLVATDGERIFVGPDNGLFTGVRNTAGSRWRSYRVEDTSLFSSSVSATFHGRDIFAPLAARLRRGILPEQTGPSHEMITLPFPAVRKEGEWLLSSVVYTDLYGNLFSSISSRDLREWTGPDEDPSRWTLELKGVLLEGLSHTFAQKEEGEELFYMGSSGYLEVAVNGGSAKERFGAERGDPLRLKVG